MSLRRILANIGGALALLLSGGCAQLDMAHTASVAQSVPPSDAQPGPALWQVKRRHTTIYLFGTFHKLPDSVHWYDQRIARALESSGELVTEIDMRDPTAATKALASEAKLPPGETLRSLMNPQQRTDYEKEMASLGLPANTLDRFEPWFAALQLSGLPLLRSGYSRDEGVEQQLEDHFTGNTHAALETVQQQVDLFDKMPMAQQLTFLDDTVHDLPDAAAHLDAMVAQWLKGDAVKLGKLLHEGDDDPALDQRLLFDRNARWADWIVNRLHRPGTVFIAVGAAHLTGPHSVQDQLEKRGYKVTRVWR